MCGIAGIIGLAPEPGAQALQQMTAAIQHRGPDAEGVFIDEQAALGHCRLSIIDLSSGANQPFHDLSDRYVIVFNGEIYNFLEVREQLDYKWRTSSDTEVILAAYIKWGKDCLQQLNGMFAFAIWDKSSRELFMARDRIGVKPFYYYQGKDLFIFGSEIRAILQTGHVGRNINRQALCQYLEQSAVKTPLTMIDGISQLMPGECATLKNGELIRSSYWQIDRNLDTGIAKLDYEATKEKTRALFEASIRNRMVSDVKVGAFLSGGIDSSAVVAVMSMQSKTPVETFSIVFDEKDFDESQYSRMIAEKYKTKHTEFKLRPEELIAHLPDFIGHMDSPSADGINTYMVSKLVAQTGIKVVLTGIGGDELFAGYPNFRRWKSNKKDRLLLNNPFARLAVNVLGLFMKGRVIDKVRDFQQRKGGDLEKFYQNSRSVFMKQDLDRLMKMPAEAHTQPWMDLDAASVKRFPLYSQFSIAELSNYTLDVLLKDTDQMSMAWALEVREPFFDYKMLEFILSVPDNFKQDGHTPKKLLVDALGDLLPREIVYRPKKGFTFPWDYWMRNELKAYCEESINRLSGLEIFHAEYLLNLWQRFLDRDKTVIWMQIWSLVILDRWMLKNNISE